MKIKNECKSLLNDYYNRMKKQMYYSTKQIMQITNISLRTLRYRMSLLKDEYDGIESLMRKVNRKWQIHHDLLHHFLPQIKRKGKLSVYDIDWQTFITWAPLNDYCEEYHSVLIKKIMDLYPKGLFLPVIEQNKNGVNHVHMVTNIIDSKLEHNIKEIFEDYWAFYEYRLEVEPVQDKVLVVDYTLKDSMAVESVNIDNSVITKILNRYENERFY